MGNNILIVFDAQTTVFELQWLAAVLLSGEFICKPHNFVSEQCNTVDNGASVSIIYYFVGLGFGLRQWE